MTFLHNIPIIAEASGGGGGGGTVDWSKLKEKLNTVGSGTKDLVDIIQDFWYIPMFFALIIIAVLVFAGGREGRVQAKSKLGYFLIGTALIMMLPSAVSLVAGLFGREPASSWTFHI